MKKINYLIIPYIALGIVLSSVIGISYQCDGGAEYYGSPFVFKQQSLGSSMTYFYSVSGVLLNMAVWSILLLLMRKVIIYFMEKAGNSKLIRNIYTGLIALLIVCTTLTIAMQYAMLGSGFEKGSNYWYMNMDQEAKDWGNVKNLNELEGLIKTFRTK